MGGVPKGWADRAAKKAAPAKPKKAKAKAKKQ